MKAVLPILALLCAVSTFSFGQSVAGAIWLSGTDTTGNPIVGFANYVWLPEPWQTHSGIAASDLTDPYWNGQFAVSNGDIVHLEAGLATSNIVTGENALAIEQTGDWISQSWVIHSIHSSAPFYRQYDWSDGSMLASIPANVLPDIPVDLKVIDDEVFLLYGDHVKVFDAITLDSVGTIQTIHPIGNQGFNDHFAVESTTERLFVDVEYATGAERFSVMEIQRSTMSADTVFHLEFYSNRSELVINDTAIFFGEYPSRYVFASDSLHHITGSNQYIIGRSNWFSDEALFGISTDSSSIQTFVLGIPGFGQQPAGLVSTPLANTTGMMHWGGFERIQPESVEEIALKNRIRIVPNPTAEMAVLSTDGIPVLALQVSSISGKVLPIQVEMNGPHVALHLAEFPVGVYVVRVSTAAGTSSHKLVKH